MKRTIVTLLLGLLLVPAISQATDFTDNDNMYGWNGSAQFWQTWADHMTQLQGEDWTATGAWDFTGASSLSMGSIALSGEADGMDDDNYNGITITGRAAGEALTQWDLVRLANDADPWHQANAAAAGEFPAIGIVVAGTSDTVDATVLLRGVVRNEGWTGLTPGGAVYLGETAGTLTQTAPSTSGDCIQIVGWALSDSEILFDFSRPYSEVE